MQSFPIRLRAQQTLRFCGRLHIGALRSPLSPFAPPNDTCSSPRSPPKDLPLRGRGTARRRWKEFTRIARPITLRASSRSPLYNPGCRVETLLVSMGVMGFLGDLRGRNSKSPPNPLGPAERVPRPQAVEGVPPHSVESVYALNPHSILTAYSGCNSFAPKPSIFQPTVEIWSSGSAVPALPAGLTITRGFAPLRLVTP